MMELLFVPNGRINSGEFMKAALILILLSVIMAIPAFMGMKALAMILGIVSYALIYPWVVIWIKRYHDAGKAGAHCLIPIGVYIVGATAFAMFFLLPGIMETMQATSSGASQDEIKEISENMEASVRMPMLIGGTILSLAVAFLFNTLIKGDPGENQFGPAT